MIKILVDTLGGDNSPKANIDGAIMALKQNKDIHLILVGDEDAIKSGLEGAKVDMERVSIVHAPDVIDCNDKPTEAMKFKKVSVQRAILRAIIELWQRDNELLISYADGHTCFEELCFLEHVKLLDKATSILEKFEGYLKSDVEEIKAYVAESSEVEKRTSFSFMRERLMGITSQNQAEEDPIGEVDPVGLYDPNKIPRFWKRFLRGQSVTEGEDKLSTDERTEEDPVDVTEEETGEVASTEE